MARSSRKRDADVQGAPAFLADASAPRVVIEPPRASDNGVDELRERLVDLQSTVEQLLAKAETIPEPLSGDPEVDRAARTLRFAQQTADSVIAEAREEALAIVSDAERQRGEIIRRARQQADQDYSSERDRVEMSSAAWQAQRAEVLDQLDSLTAIFATYQEGLSHLDTTVSSVAERLRSGFIAEPIVIDPTADDAGAGPEATAAVESVEAVEVADAVDIADTAEVAEAISEVDPQTIDLTDAASAPEAADATRNPFARPPVSHLAAVDADSDPFVFDVAELPETTGDFGWETDDTGSGGATTF